MTQFLKYVLFICCCFHFASLRGEEDCFLLSLEEMEEFSLKNYVQPEQIYLSEDKIFVQTEKGFVPVDSLMTDMLGLYYKESTDSKKSDRWICPDCHHDNERPCRSLCENCPWPTSHSLDLQCNIKGAKEANDKKKEPEYYYGDPDEREYPSLYWDDEDYYDCYIQRQ